KGFYVTVITKRDVFVGIIIALNVHVSHATASALQSQLFPWDHIISHVERSSLQLSFMPRSSLFAANYYQYLFGFNFDRRDWSAAICGFASRKFSGLQSSAMSTISSAIH